MKSTYRDDYFDMVRTLEPRSGEIAGTERRWRVVS
jgi:hypothetical protein